MKKLSALLLILTGLILFNGCSNDVDINASYELITVVYGLLDPNEDTTYLKINKAFLGEDNALIMAQIPDSSEFIEKLDVRIWPDDNPDNVYHFDTITITNKEDGIFYNPNQIIYYSAFNPEPDKKYKLRILYKQNEITSECTTIAKFVSSDISKPGFAKAIGFDYDLINPVRWNKKDNAPRYDVTIRFHYKEIWEGSSDTVYRFIDWHNAIKKATSSPEVESLYNGSVFFSALNFYVPYEDASQEAKVMHRYTGNTDFIVEAGGTTLNTYMEVNEPSNSIVQDRPEYTNIENGIGIFSSRSRAVKTKKLNDETKARVQDLYWLKFVY